MPQRSSARAGGSKQPAYNPVAEMKAAAAAIKRRQLDSWLQEHPISTEDGSWLMAMNAAMKTGLTSDADAAYTADTLLAHGMKPDKQYMERHASGGQQRPKGHVCSATVLARPAWVLCPALLDALPTCTAT